MKQMTPISGESQLNALSENPNLHDHLSFHKRLPLPRLTLSVCALLMPLHRSRLLICLLSCKKHAKLTKCCSI